MPIKRKKVHQKKVASKRTNLVVILFFLLSIALILVSFLFNRSAEKNSPSTAQSAGTGWLSGASSINKNYQEFATWRGSPVTIAGVWSDATADDQENQWAYKDYKDFPENLDLSVGAIYGSETFASVANGTLDTRLKKALSEVDANWGSKKTIFLRFAHEFNGSWYKWSVKKSNVEDYKKAFQRFHGLVQSELVAKGRNAKVVWSPNDGSHSDASAEEMYPGDQYVDVIGVDSYDWDPQRTESNWESAANAKEKDGSPRGIEAWRQFALAKGKPMAFPEWGCNPSEIVDCPFYIKKMNEFFRANAGTGPGQVWYEIYFNAWDKDKIFPTTNVPQAAAMYKSLKWGDGGVSNTTPVITSGTTPIVTLAPTEVIPTYECIGGTNCVPSATPTVPSEEITPGSETTPEITQSELEPTNPALTQSPDGDNGKDDEGSKGRGGFFQMFIAFLRSILELLLRLLGFNS